jgi:hypothetical protein
MIFADGCVLRLKTEYLPTELYRRDSILFLFVKRDTIDQLAVAVQYL